MIGEKPTPSVRPPIEWFIAYFQFASAKEIAVVYDLTLEEVEREMKKLAFAKKSNVYKCIKKCFGATKKMIILQILMSIAVRMNMGADPCFFFTSKRNTCSFLNHEETAPG